MKVECILIFNKYWNQYEFISVSSYSLFDKCQIRRNANNYKSFYDLSCCTFLTLTFKRTNHCLFFCKVVVFQVSCKNTYVKVFSRFISFLSKCDWSNIIKKLFDYILVLIYRISNSSCRELVFLNFGVEIE